MEGSQTRRTFGGVLCGGASSRMGSNKALLGLNGVPLAAHVAGVLRAAGAEMVVALGGDPATVETTSLPVVADRVPDAGPLAGILGGLAHFDTMVAPAADAPYVAIFAACDLPQITPDVVALLMKRVVDGADVAAVEVAGRAQWHLSVVSSTAHGRLGQVWDSGERSLGRAFRQLEPALVPLEGVLAHLAPSVADVDTPEDWNAIDERDR